MNKKIIMIGLVLILLIVSNCNYIPEKITTGMVIHNLSNKPIDTIYVIPYDYHDGTGRPLWDEEHKYDKYLVIDRKYKIALEEGDYNIRFDYTDEWDTTYTRIRHHLHVKDGYITLIELKYW